MAKKAVNSEKASLADVLAQLNKTFHEGVVMKMGDKGIEVETIPTGALTLDIALGVGGLPKGRIIELYGPESSGKSTLAMHVVAEAQKRGETCAYIDAEHAMDPKYATAIGVNVGELLISQPDYGEQALTICEKLVGSGEIGVIVVDSVAALTPKAEIDGEMDDMQMGAQARMMSKAMRKLTAIIHDTGTTCIFINQLREKIGILFGSPETTPGGRALKFYSSVRLDIRRKEVIKDGTTFLGSKTKVKVVKNKVSPPFREAEFDIMYGEGISSEGCILDLGVEYGIVGKSGAWYTYNGEQLGQGRDKSKLVLKNDPALTEEIESLIRKAVDL